MNRDNPLAIVDIDQAIESDPGQLWQWGSHDEFPMLPPEPGGGFNSSAALSVSGAPPVGTRSAVKRPAPLNPLSALASPALRSLAGNARGNASPRKAAHGPL